jgi:hypothetical protein
MNRTTKNELISAVRVLNQMVGANAVAHQPGSYFLQGAYGGWQLQQVVGTGTILTGATAVFPGYRSKRELLELIHAFRAGIRVGQESASIPETT